MSKLAIKGGVPVRSRPFPRWPRISEYDLKFIAEALKNSSWYRGMGNTRNEVDEFEELFIKRHSLGYGIGVVNGTAALNLAMQVLDLEPGSEILVTPYTYVASAFCILKAGLKPIFVDIDEDTYNIDSIQIEKAITSQTRGVVLVHFGGQPVDFDRIMPIVQKNNLKVIEDCAHAHGAEWRGKPVGSWGDIACFSFHAAKNLTCGEGGFIGTTDLKLYKKCWSQHNMGREKGGDWDKYYELGENLRFSPISASLLLSQYQNFEQLQNLRNQNITYFRKLLKEIPFLKPLVEDDRVTKHGLHIFICRYYSEKFYGIPRHRFLAAIQAEGIHCYAGYKKPLYYSSPLKEFYRECPVAEKACAKEAIWFEQSFFLGTKEDIDDIFNAICKIQNNYKEIVANYNFEL